jgi:demethylmenaquinone methyltransferase/2-methoxy-6-polyprenyl-1,4-benzoquinol methylase
MAVSSRDEGSAGESEPALDELLAGQVAYYRARAGEYDAWWLRQGRFDRGAATNAEWFADVAAAEAALADWLAARRPRSAVELACGTGLFTRRVAPAVEMLDAIDASPEVIARNRARLASLGIGNVTFHEADVFAWRPSRRYDLVFMSFWLSHVPRSRFAAFFATLRDALAPGGAVYIIDSAHDATSTATDHVLPERGSEVATRKLDDGSMWQVVKVFWTPDGLDAALLRLGVHRAGARRGRAVDHVINVRLLAHPVLVHHALRGELARGLVPPDRAALALVVDDRRLLREQVADERRVLGHVVAGRQHSHGGVQ